MLYDMAVERDKIIACFLPASSSLLEKSVLNSLAARMAPANTTGREPMVHTELFFPQHEVGSDVSGVSCGIHYGGKVFMAPKMFSRKDWLFRSFSCTPRQRKMVQEFCQGQTGHGFNYMGYYTPCNIASRDQKNGPWYCSELTSAALAHAGIIDYDYAAASHPDALYEYVLENTYADCGRTIDFKNIKI